MNMSNNQVFNFSAGPAVMPKEVIQVTQTALVDYNSSGIGVAELSHRSSQFEEIIGTAEKNLRELLNISDDYAVLFLQGGASMQFSMVPMNILPQGKVGNYLLTGAWAEKAFKDAALFGKTHSAASSADRNHCYIPSNLELSADAAYLHFTSNNTIFGTQFKTEPTCGSLPLVCDASSDFLHKKIDVSKYGLIYAGAQKNCGPAGVTLVVIRKDLLEIAPKSLPVMLNYRTYQENKSLYNTPPTLPIFMVGEVLKWCKAKGGLDGVYKNNQEKAALLYDKIDSSDFYQGHADKDCRSLMNVTFRLAKTELEADFAKEATAAGFKELKGHRSVGGLRASIYNAFPKEGVSALVKFMDAFEAKHG